MEGSKCPVPHDKPHPLLPAAAVPPADPAASGCPAAAHGSGSDILNKTHLLNTTPSSSTLPTATIYAYHCTSSLIIVHVTLLNQMPKPNQLPHPDQTKPLETTRVTSTIPTAHGKEGDTWVFHSFHYFSSQNLGSSSAL